MPELPLEELLSIDDAFERRLLLAALLQEALEDKSAIVGGHAVEAYTLGDYATGDVDLVVFSKAPVAAILQAWGFLQQGRIYWHEQLGVAVDLIGERLAGDWGRVVQLEVHDHYAAVIGPEDLIIDRLNGCVHWNSEEHCAWAERLARRQRGNLDLHYLRDRAAEEGVDEMWQKILEKLDNASDEI
ncbi:MAG: hypothetical protein ACYC63_14355 [Armatimonadota bacterium]